MNTDLDTLMPLGRRGLIQATNLVLTILIASLATIKIIVLGFDSPPIPALFVVTAGLANAIYIKRNGSMDIAAWILVVTMLLGLIASSIYSGGFSASVLLLAPLIPIMTVLLINTKAASIFLVLVYLILTGVFILGVYGYVPETPYSQDVVMFGRYIVLTCLCLIST